MTDSWGGQGNTLVRLCVASIKLFIAAFQRFFLWKFMDTGEFFFLSQRETVRLGVFWPFGHKSWRAKCWLETGWKREKLSCISRTGQFVPVWEQRFYWLMATDLREYLKPNFLIGSNSWTTCSSTRDFEEVSSCFPPSALSISLSLPPDWVCLIRHPLLSLPPPCQLIKCVLFFSRARQLAWDKYALVELSRLEIAAPTAPPPSPPFRTHTHTLTRAEKQHVRSRLPPHTLVPMLICIASRSKGVLMRLRYQVLPEERVQVLFRAARIPTCPPAPFN